MAGMGVFELCIFMSLICLAGAFSAMENVTRLLDKLLLNYNKAVRPGIHGTPLTINTNILIRSMGPITEAEMTYSMQCYLRQSWYDERLKFDLQNRTEVTLSNSFLKDIWKPNTFFLNGRRSVQPNITVPNVFVRIRNDGSIYMSRRLTISARCPMNLLNYPMDEPVCFLKIGGYGYTVDDVIYVWQTVNGSAVDVYDDVTLSQFDIGSITTKNVTYNDAYGTFSSLEVYFYLRRHIGFFMLQTYLPCTLIVCLSWVSFWINRAAAPARVLLGVTTILSTAAVGLIQRDGLPRVPYATALDVYLNVCIVYNLAAIIQYAAVNYYTKLIPKEHNCSDDEDEITENNKEDLYQLHSTESKIKNNGDLATYIIKENGTPCLTRVCSCLTGDTRSGKDKMENSEDGNSVSKIDLISRYVFPTSFGLFHVFYWTWYLGK